MSSRSVLIWATRASLCCSWTRFEALVTWCWCSMLWAFSWSSTVPSNDTTDDWNKHRNKNNQVYSKTEYVHQAHTSPSVNSNLQIMCYYQGILIPMLPPPLFSDVPISGRHYKSWSVLSNVICTGSQGKGKCGALVVSLVQFSCCPSGLWVLSMGIKHSAEISVALGTSEPKQEVNIFPV